MASDDEIAVRSSRLWALFHFNLTRWIFPTRMIADHIGILTKEVRFWLTPWARTDDHLPLSHIAEVLHTRGLLWDSISVESSGAMALGTMTLISYSRRSRTTCMGSASG